MTSDLDIRWKQRFQNFHRAFSLLRDAFESDLSELSQLEKEGIIQRFEYTFELAWKVLKDKMESDGLVIDKISPKMVIKQAFSAKYIADVELWLQMTGDRNLMSHTYDFSKFEAVIQTIKQKYLPLLDDWHETLFEEFNHG